MLLAGEVTNALGVERESFLVTEELVGFDPIETVAWGRLSPALRALLQGLSERRVAVPDLYANSLMVSRSLLDQAPDQVRALVQGLNRGLIDTLSDIDAGIDAVALAAPSINPEVQRRRLLGTLAAEMAHPEGARIGIGDVDDARLERGLALLACTCRWPRVPTAGEVFSRDFLPVLHDRVRTLAASHAWPL